MAGDELVAVAVAVAAEPAECSRCVLMCLLGVIGSTLFVIGTGLFAYVEHVEQLPDLTWLPPPDVAFFLSFLFTVLGGVIFSVFIVLFQEWQRGNPEGDRLVDSLLLF